jgi:5-methylcytosine-specific restriction enzyme subunit McrC
MSELIKIEEYEEWQGSLADADWDFLSAELSRQLTLRREIRDGKTVCVLNPNQYVGLIMLPSGTRLQITPKVPVSNLFYMISMAFDLAWPFREELARLEVVEDVLAAIAQIFAELVEHRIEAGLYRSYVEQEENLSCIRGRISFAEDFRHNLLARHRIYCRYAEFTWDIEENQIIRQVAHLLSGWGFYPQLRLRLRRLDTALAEVQPTALPSSAIGRFRYSRFNDDYRQIHQLCRLFLEGSSLSEQLGVWDSRTFLMDMNKLFEAFVTQILQESALSQIRIIAQSRLALGEDEKVKMRPDLIIESDGEPILVADCKYKQTEPEIYKNHDFYQILAYCTASGVRRGLLIYPLHSGPLQDFVKVRNVDILIEQTTINLGLPFSEFRDECKRFADAVLTLAPLKELSLQS